MSARPGAAIAMILLGLTWAGRPLAAELAKPSETDHRYYEAWGLSADDAGAHTLYANGMLKVAKFPQALAHYERALELEPDNVPAHYGYAIALLRVKRPEAALDHFARVVGSGSDLEASAHSNMGKILGRLGRRDEAFPHFQRTVELNPDQAEARYNVGAGYHRRGRLEDATAQLRRAVELDPSLGHAHRRLAAVHVEAGRHRDAIAAYEALLRINKRDLVALHDMGVAWDALGEPARARKTWERALEKARKSVRYRTLQKQLEERLAAP
jgi:tetratricopeptide (TPR) repeat protein